MSRDEGFPVADRDTGMLRDLKVVRAFRMGGLPAVIAWEAIVDASWGKGDRVTLEEAVISLPYGLDPDALLPVLVSAGLVGSDGLIVEETWERWFRPAWERREQRRRSGAIGGARSWDQRRSRNGSAPLKQRSTDAEASLPELVSGAEPVRPSVQPPVRPSVPPPPTSGGRRKDGTNSRATGSAPRQVSASPRQNGHSPRQEREAQKRGGMPLSVHEILRRASGGGA